MKKNKVQNDTAAKKRKAHFANGGTTKTWLGCSAKFGDKRMKRTSRGSVKKKSIEDADGND